MYSLNCVYEAFLSDTKACETALELTLIKSLFQIISFLKLVSVFLKERWDQAIHYILNEVVLNIDFLTLHITLK